ncbi:hypothetical protein WJX81_004230, partial [Elliptochloris bilobata]
MIAFPRGIFRAPPAARTSFFLFHGAAAKQGALGSRSGGFLLAAHHESVLAGHAERTRPCRCQAAPEASGGGSLFNLRAWGAGVVNGLKLGQAEAPRGTVEEQDEDEMESLPAALPAPGERSSWDEWEQYFLDVDDALERAEEAHVAMEAAVADEQYGEAARLRAELGKLESRDSVGGVLREYSAALGREDYGEAARLRDAGGLGLAGWWHARSEADPCGHLLRIAPDFGRLSGLMYTSRDLAVLKGWSNEAATAFPANAFLAAPDFAPEVEVTFEEAGVPCLEVFIAQGADGELRQQASVLRHAAGEPTKAGPSSSLAEALAEGVAAGGMRVRVDAAALGEEDVIHISLATERFSRPAPDATGPDASDVAASASGASSFSLGELVQDLNELVSSLGSSGSGVIEVHGEAVGDAEHQLAQVNDTQRAPDDEDDDDDDGRVELSGNDFMRAPAHILRPSRHSFVLSVPPAVEAGGAPRDPAAHQFLASDPSPNPDSPTIASDLSAMVAAGPAELLAALRRRAAALTGSKTRNPASIPSSDPKADEEASAPAAEAEAAAELVRADGAEADGAGEGKESAWVKVAGEVRRVHEARNPNRPLAMSDAKLAEVIRSAAASAILGMQRDTSVNFCLEGTVTYTRLRTDYPRTDPFSGLYLGAFGSVGAQALQLQRFTWE